MKRTRTPEQIRTAFEVQKAALESSAKGYDCGSVWEALRLATSVYTLVHDGGRNSKSILTQMNAKSGLRFLCSSDPVSPSNMIASHNLVMMEASLNGARYRPVLEAMPEQWRWTAFSTWWEKDPIFSSGNGKGLVTRKNLVFNLRNKEGGAHYDPAVAESEYTAMAERALWTFSSSQHQEVELHGLELATMRQIAFEVMQSLRNAQLHG